MSNPPALPEPIKPPNGDFTLEERKWREGITRAINNLSAALDGKEDKFTKGNLSGDGSYISVSGGTGAVIGNGTSLSLVDTNLAKLNANNVFTGSLNTFNSIKSNEIQLSNYVTLNTEASGTVLQLIGYDTVHSENAYLQLADGALRGFRTNGTLDCGTSVVRWGTVYAANLNANGTATLNTISTTADNTYTIGGSGARFANVWSKGFRYSDRVQSYTEGNNLFFEWYNPNANASRTICFTDNDFWPFQGNTVSLGTSNNHWAAGYINDVFCDDVTFSSDFKIALRSNYFIQVDGYDVSHSDKMYLQFIDGCFRGFRANGALDLGSSGVPFGDIYAWNTTIQPSDIRLKENIEPLENALTKLNKLNIYEFTWKKNPETVTFGVIAQEAIKTVPEAIKVTPDKDGGLTLGVYTSNMLYLALKAIQELSDKVKQLEGVWK